MLKNKAVRYCTQFGRRVKQNYNETGKKLFLKVCRVLYNVKKMS